MGNNQIMQTKSNDLWQLIEEGRKEMGVAPLQNGENSVVLRFPPPPRLDKELRRSRLSMMSWQSMSDTETTSDSQSDTRVSTIKGMRSPMRSARYASRSSCHGGGEISPSKTLPPIGVFWDIENCQIPRGKSALTVAQAIREKFFSGYREAEFVVVCDVKKETPQVIQELNDAQLNLIHVGSTYKNAADEKLRQSMRRFADTHGSSAAIVLISGDVNFAPDLSDLRHRKKIYIILVHNDLCSETLIVNADEHHSFQSLVKSLPIRTIVKPAFQSYEVLISNLPLNRDPCKVRGRLKRLAENCGGRVGYVIGLQTTLRFPSLEFALRAKKRLEGENVFGSAITVGSPLPVENNSNSPMKSRFGGNRKKSEDTMHYQPAVVQYVAPIPWQSANLSLVGMYGAMPIHPPIGPPPTLPSMGQDMGGHPGGPVPVQPPPPPLGNAQLVWDPAWHWNNSNPTNGPGPVQLLQRGRPILGSSQNAIEKANDKSINSNIWIHNNHHDNTLVANGNVTDDGSTTANGSLSDINQSSSSCTMGWARPGARRAQSVSPVTPTVTLPANWQWQNKHSNNANAPNSSLASSSASTALVAAASTTTASNNWNTNKISNHGSNRKCRTPSPYMSSTTSASGHHRPYSPYSQSHSDNERSLNTSATGPVELQVTNLDQSIDLVEMKKLLLSIFQEHVMVLHVAVFVRSGGSLAAVVRVASQQGAQYAISQLHRRKIGQKRIMISYARATSPHNPQVVRSQVANLLREVPGHQLPLFKFREMFESRYMNSISASDLYRMHDVCTITESVNGRTISLNAEHRSSTPSLISSGNQDNGMQQTGVLVCTLHARVPHCNDDKGWAEQEAPGLPCLRVPLPEFSSRLLALLHTHNNMLPLASFCDCYESEFGSISLDETGVPLEHLVTCVSGVQIKVSESCAKFLCTTPKNQMADFEKNEDLDNLKGTVSPPLAYNLLIFSRELVDLLRNQPHCILSFNKFIPSYHHHFHRQCRVADYGFTRLIDLFEALPHIVQVMGDGNKKMLTLSHRSQMRRFTSDLLRLLKLQPNKVVNVNELLAMFEKNLGRVFDPVDYGLCYLSDLLSQLVENTVVITHDGDNTYIAIPKREQTLEEVERTKLFAQEVVELLSLSRQCTIKFEKFIPAYHHHFGYQCKVADFGFTKLIELFEAIPQVVKIEEDGEGERTVTLVNEVKLKVLADQVADLVHSRFPPGLPLSALGPAFQWQYGYSLKPTDYDCQDLCELITKLHSTVKLQELDSGPTLVLVDQKHLRNISLRVWRVLIESANGKMSWTEFEKKYKSLYKQSCSLDMISRELQDTVNVIREKEVLIQLTSVKLFAHDVYRLLCSSEGRLAVNSFEATYARCFGTTVQPSHYGYHNLIALLQAIPQFVILRGKGVKRLIILNKELAVAGISLPSGLIRNPARSNSSSDVENKDQQQSWPVPPSESLLRGLRFPNKSEEQKAPENEEPEIESKTPKKEWRTTWPNFNKAQESAGKPNFVVQLPKFATPPSPLYSLVSPCKYLLPATGSTPVWPLPLPPDPSELPMPKLYLEDGPTEKKGPTLPQKVDLLQDSEGSCSGSEVTEQANTTNVTVNSVRRKLRLAAHFQTPLE